MGWKDAPLVESPRWAGAPEVAQPDEVDELAGSPVTRFALGAASPFLGAAQLVAEPLGFTGVTDHLKRLEEMKRRGMSPAVELRQLQQARDNLSRLQGYEATIANIDRRMAELGPSPETTTQDVDVAGLAGAVLSPPVLAAMKIPVAGGMAGRAAQGAAIGAGMGALTPVTEGDEFATAKAAQVGAGAVIGGAIPAAIDLGTKGTRLLRDIVAPHLVGPKKMAGRLLAESAGAKRAEVESLLARADDTTTAAEAAAPAGSAEFSALQRIGEQRLPTEYRDLAERQAASRLSRIREVGKTPADVEAARTAREAAGRHNYGNVENFLVRMDEEIGTLLSRPSMEKAVARAEDLAKEAGRPLTNDVKSFHWVKMAMDDMVQNPERFGIGASEVRAINQTRVEFLRWLEKKAPLYEKARTVYAEMSKPINQMQVGQELEKALTKPIGEGERAGVFGTAMREVPRTIKKATGQARFDELSEVLTPEQLSKVRSVYSDLQRKAQHEDLVKWGFSRVGEITSPFGLPATGPLHQQYMIFKTVLGRISRSTTDDALNEVAKAMQVPREALKLLRSAPDKNKQAVIDNIIAQKVARGAIAASSSLAGEAVQQ